MGLFGIDPGDFLPSIKDVIEDIPSSVRDILEDTEDSINKVASSISDVFDAILDKPVQFAIQAGTSIFAPQLSPFVNAAIAAQNGASPQEIIKATLISAVSDKIGSTATTVSGNVLEELNFSPKYVEPFTNILGNTIKKVGKGTDSDFAVLSSLFSEIRDPLNDFSGKVLEDFDALNVILKLGKPRNILFEKLF